MVFCNNLLIILGPYSINFINFSSANELQISRYLQQQALLKKNYVARSKKSTNIKTCSEAKLQIKPRKRRQRESLGTETVDYIPYRKQRPLLSETATVNFEDGSGSDYVPSSDAGESTDGNFLDSVLLLVF